jgi:putative Mg2+ transporter-C (MgtC) family protein
MDSLQELWNGIANEAPYMLRLLVATVCGCAIGIERSLRNKEAGIRTHIVVTIGAALAMILSKYAFGDVADADASRIASQIITGVSFLGAGVIFVRGATIRGLTTAAGIWTTAVIGMAIGAGMYPLGIFSTVLIVGLQLFLHRYVHIEKNITSDIDAVLADIDGAVPRFRAQLEKHGMDIIGFDMQKGGIGELHCVFSVQMKDAKLLSHIETFMQENPDIHSISM